MLTRLQILGFQKHRDLRIRLGPITTIIGPTDAGKSAVVRALRWLAFNKPSGLAFRHWGRKQVVVRLEVDGHKIIRTKTDTTNTYKLDGKLYKAFGAGVPPAITALLNIEDINIQRQADPHFWLAAAPGQVAKSLNAIVDLSIIDSTMAYLGREHKQAKAHTEVSRERLGEAKASFKQLQWVPVFIGSLGKLGQLEKQAADKAATTAAVATLVGQAIAGQQALTRLLAAAAVASKGVVAGNADVQARLLRQAVTRWGLAQQQASRPIPPTKALAAIYKQAAVAQTLVWDLKGLVNRAATTKAQLEAFNEEIAATIRELTTYTKGEVCPLCQKPF